MPLWAINAHQVTQLMESINYQQDSGFYTYTWWALLAPSEK